METINRNQTDVRKYPSVSLMFKIKGKYNKKQTKFYGFRCFVLFYYKKLFFFQVNEFPSIEFFMCIRKHAKTFENYIGKSVKYIILYFCTMTY